MGVQLCIINETDMKTVISGKDLRAIGYPQSVAIALAIECVQAHYGEENKEEALATLSAVLEDPQGYREHAHFAPVADALCKADEEAVIALQEPVAYTAYGSDFIEEGARAQMETAIRLPVAVAGALMPDAHQGYGLPIGGVLATRNAVIPYGVGVDIGCRMCLSIYDVPEAYFLDHQSEFKRELIAHTKFGAGAGYHGRYKAEHAVLEHPVFGTVAPVKRLLDKAASQLGTSGGGNHFVEWGIVEILSDENEFGIPKGKYLGLLSHSGSRGLGATLANHYTRVAKEVCRLPKEAANLAYLDMDSEEGQEYWLAMNLAGDYASACHAIIHQKLTVAIGGQLLGRVENHHNFAWKEQWQGEEVIVHRKGATPASKGVLGIIPGSMTAPGFVVRGKGKGEAIHSASHGAGRQMSRTRAEQTFTREGLSSLLKDHGVTLIGGGLDEAPGAYKDIHQVMSAQSELVEVLAQFTPRMVRMADDGSRED